jgi:large subunit ribosomal protein L6
MQNFFFIEKKKNQWQEHLGIQWFGIQSSFSLLYFKHNEKFYSFPTKKNVYFYYKSLNKQDNISSKLLSKIESMIQGSSLGFSVKMRLVGVGYRIEEEKQNQNRVLKLKLGLSHDLEIPLKKGIKFKKFHDRSSVYIFTFENFQMLKNFTTKIKRYRPLEPYKGKGFRYVNEMFKRKQGKKTNL